MCNQFQEPLSGLGLLVSHCRVRDHDPAKSYARRVRRTAVWGLFPSDQIEAQNRLSAWELSLAHTSGGLAGGDSPVCVHWTAHCSLEWFQCVKHLRTSAIV